MLFFTRCLATFKDLVRFTPGLFSLGGQLIIRRVRKDLLELIYLCISFRVRCFRLLLPRIVNLHLILVKHLEYVVGKLIQEVVIVEHLFNRLLIIRGPRQRHEVVRVRASLEGAELQLIVKDSLRVNVVSQSRKLFVQVKYLLERHVRPVDVAHYVLDHHFIIGALDVPVAPRDYRIYDLVFTLHVQVLVLKKQTKLLTLQL